mgnify:CR=1 FL=1
MGGVAADRWHKIYAVQIGVASWIKDDEGVEFFRYKRLNDVSP